MENREEVLEVVGMWVGQADEGGGSFNWEVGEGRTLYARGFEDAAMGLVEDLAEVLGFKVEELREGVG